MPLSGADFRLPLRMDATEQKWSVMPRSAFCLTLPVSGIHFPKALCLKGLQSPLDFARPLQHNLLLIMRVGWGDSCAFGRDEDERTP